MAQALFGATDYKEQTLDDILEDIDLWNGYLTNGIKIIDENIKKLNELNKFSSIGCDFKLTIITSKKCYLTFIKDLDLVSKAIKSNQITNREIILMKNIGQKAWEYNMEYGKTWNIDNNGWKSYEENWFKYVEEVYGRGRDISVTLQDGVNIAERLETYKVVNPIVNQHNIINGNANIAGVNYGEMIINNVSYNLKEEAAKAIEKIEKLECPENTKVPFIDLLTEIMEDKVESSQINKDYKSIISLGCSKAYKVVSIISTFAGLAQICGIIS